MTYGPCIIQLPISSLMSISYQSASITLILLQSQALHLELQFASSPGITDSPYSVCSLFFHNNYYLLIHYKTYFIIYIDYCLSLRHV